MKRLPRPPCKDEPEDLMMISGGCFGLATGNSGPGTP